MTVRSFYRDYMLTCQPMSQPDGRFQARVVITSLAGDRTRSQRFLDLDLFDSEEAAIEHARQSGMEWIDVNHHRQG
ncbi:MAG: hypothetical protein ABL916_20505 [Burkholderiaceae bacterium]